MTSKNWRIFSVNVRFVPKPVRHHFQKFGLRPCTPQKSVTTRALNLFRSRIQIRMHILPVIKNGYYNGANLGNNFAIFLSLKLKVRFFKKLV